MVEQIIFYVATLISGILMGAGYARGYYKNKINEIIAKNQQAIERMKRSEEIILHDLLQLTPDDIAVLRKNMELPKE